MKSRSVSATELRAKFPALLDEIAEQGGPITITRQGKPVAILRPVEKKINKKRKKKWKSPANSWAGRMEIVGDIVNSDPDLWDVARK